MVDTLVKMHAPELARGLLRRKHRGKPLVEEWAEYKREERELEEQKYARRRN